MTMTMKPALPVHVRLVIVLCVCISIPCLGWQPSITGRISNKAAALIETHLMMSASSSSIETSLDKVKNALQVTVVGGTGFVGSRVCQILAAQGASVRSISKSGTVPKWCRDEEWTSTVTWLAVDLLDATPSAIDEAMGDNVDAVVSCVGVIGTDPEILKKGNGDVNVAAFESAKRRGAKRAAFISVSNRSLHTWLARHFLWL